MTAAEKGVNEVNIDTDLKTSQNENTCTSESVATTAGNNSYVNIPRGRPKSGRLWKTEKKQRFSEFARNKNLKTSWEKKMQQKIDKKTLQLKERELKDARSKEKEMRRIRQEENKKRKLENQQKSEVLQTIKNTAKIKRLRKKQLRQIAKR